MRSFLQVRHFNEHGFYFNFKKNTKRKKKQNVMSTACSQQIFNDIFLPVNKKNNYNNRFKLELITIYY